MINKQRQYKPFDIVIAPKGSIGMITEVDESREASVEFFKTLHRGDYNAWYKHGELTVIDTLPGFLAAAMAHPFGTNQKLARKIFK